MDKIHFKGGQPLSHKGRTINKATFEKLDNGTIIVYEKDEPSDREPVHPDMNSFDELRKRMTYFGWTEVIKIEDEKQKAKCECGAAKTSNPDLHSPIMPCPLYKDFKRAL